jgi:hypothetical protein
MVTKKEEEMVKAHILAIHWWQMVKVSSAKCDRCCSVIKRGDGFLCQTKFAPENIPKDHEHFKKLKQWSDNSSGTPDLLCRQCFDSGSEIAYTG